jgi:hypothetical protein
MSNHFAGDDPLSASWQSVGGIGWRLHFVPPPVKYQSLRYYDQIVSTP